MQRQFRHIEKGWWSYLLKKSRSRVLNLPQGEDYQKIYSLLLTDVTPNRHTGESRYPEYAEITGLRLSPE